MVAAKKFTLKELATALEIEARGDLKCAITSIAPLQTAKAGQISFLDNPRYFKYLATTKASIVILSPKDATDYLGNALISQKPYLSYAKLVHLFAEKSKVVAGIHETVIMGKGCKIASSAHIGPYVVLGDNVSIGSNVQIGASTVIGEACSIGEDSVLYPRVTLYHHTTLGARTVVHSGAVIGSDGFGMANENGRWLKVPQIGNVTIGNDVEIGANTAIDRGALEDTILEDGVKVDNQVQIAHNVHIGAHTAIAGCTGIAGSTTIGSHCLIGGGAGITGHISIPSQSIIAAFSGVTKTLTEPGIYGGIPAMPIKEWRKALGRVGQLDSLFEKIKKYEVVINEALGEEKTTSR